MNHPTHEELMDHADGLLESGRAAAAEAHLRDCAECASRLRAIRTVERAIRSLPLEPAPQDLSRAVLKRIGIREAPPLLYTLFKNFAPLAALSVIMVVVYVILGKPSGAADAAASGESARGLFQMADQYSSSAVAAVNAWASTYLSFAKNSAGLAGFLLVFLGVVALLDKFIVMPRIRKRLQTHARG